MKKEIEAVCTECNKNFNIRVDLNEDVKEIKTDFCPFCKKTTEVTINSLFYKR
jgi:CxxC motif-containing protein